MKKKTVFQFSLFILLGKMTIQDFFRSFGRFNQFKRYSLWSLAHKEKKDEKVSQTENIF